MFLFKEKSPRWTHLKISALIEASGSVTTPKAPQWLSQVIEGDLQT